MEIDQLMNDLCFGSCPERPEPAGKRPEFEDVLKEWRKQRLCGSPESWFQMMEDRGWRNCDGEPLVGWRISAKSYSRKQRALKRRRA